MKQNLTPKKIQGSHQKMDKIGIPCSLHTFSKKNNEFFNTDIKIKPLTFSINKKYNISNINHSKHNQTKIDQQENFTDLSWAGEGNAFSNRMISCTNKGNTYIYNTDNGNIISTFNFDNKVLNTCAIEPTENQLIAVGSCDGSINIKNLNKLSRSDNNKGNNNLTNLNVSNQFTGHLNCISALSFMNTSFMLSASYDSIIYLWDITTQGKIVNTYAEHTGQIFSLDINDVNGNIFVTGSQDGFVKLWDIREKKANVMSFQEGKSSVNCVKFLPGRLCTLAGGYENSSLCVYDLRTHYNLGEFKKEKGDKSGLESICFSKSGGLLFACYKESNFITFWKLFGNEHPFCEYEYIHEDKEEKRGLNKMRINSEGTRIGFIHKDEVVIME